MKRAAAIVTARGGRTCHAAIIARELGVPAVVGAGDAINALTTGTVVTVSCAEGEVGHVYPGSLAFEVNRVSTDRVPRPKTRIMVNIGNPELAFHTAMLPNDGVGLARMEFIIGEHIGVHPMALVHPDRVASKKQRAAIARLTQGYDSPTDFFVQKLSEGVGRIAAAFYPKPVIVRLSDFKTNEYASLLGGAAFEPKEANPMLGFRGASRYAHPAYAEGFALECAALKRVRDEMGLRNLRVMVPFCRRAEEGRRVIAAMADNGLKRGENGLEIYVMCEIPNNVIDIDNFAALFDGFSIGSNDLTQLTLGVDRDFGDRRVRFRRARPRHARDAPSRHQRRKAQSPPRRHLRRGARQLSRNRAVSWRNSASIRSASMPPVCCAQWKSFTKPRPARSKSEAPPSRRRRVPYHALEELPPAVRRLPRHAQEIFRAAFNAAWHSYADRTASEQEEAAFRVAWAAVKRRYRKSGESWVEK